MSAVMPDWLKGKHLNGFVATGQVRGTDGTLSDSGSARAITGFTKRVKFRSNPGKENMSPVTVPRANNEIIEENSSVEIEVLLSNNTPNPLTAIAYAFDIIKVVWVQGTGASGSGAEQWTYYGSRGNFDTGIESKGSNMSTLVLDQVEIGLPNPALVVA